MKFPVTKIDISKYTAKIESLLNDEDCAIFIDTNILSQLYRLNDNARQDFYSWVKKCGDRFHVPAWVIHEYSDKIYSKQTKEFLTELSNVKKYTGEIEKLSYFVKGYAGASMLKGTAYEGKVDCLKKDIDNIVDGLNKISKAINNSFNEHQSKVHIEITEEFEPHVLNTNIYTLLSKINDYSSRYDNRIPPGYKDSNKNENAIGDLLIWREILDYCSNNRTAKVIFITRDRKQDIVYEPNEQILGSEGRCAAPSEKIRIAKNSLVYEFKLATGSEDFYIVDFETFVKIKAKEYRDLAISFQVASANENDSSDDTTSQEEGEEEITYQKTEISIEDDKSQVLHESPQTTSETEVVTQPLYSGVALMDSQYDTSLKHGCMNDFITNLKSHNWYIQNPAIDKLLKWTFPEETNEGDKDSVFVLGRNILQSAEGSSGSAISYIENLYLNIQNWPKTFQVALIDGILYEIFFDSHGKIRSRSFKASFIEDILKNIRRFRWDRPFDFINMQLSKVTSRFVPKVGGQEKYLFCFDFNEQGNTVGLKCNGQNISSTFISRFTSEFADSTQIKPALMSYYAIPQSQIQVEGIPQFQEKIKYIMEKMDAFELPF